MTFTKLLRDKEIDDNGNCWWVFLKLCHCQIIWYLFAGFKAMILCSVHSMIREMFSAKLWFVKTSTRIVKYESRVTISNPEEEYRICADYKLYDDKF